MQRVVALVALVACGSAAGATGGPRVLARVATGASPCGAVAYGGAVWVANDGGSLVRVAPRTNRVTARIRLQRGTCSVAAGAGALWVASYARSTVTRVEPATGRTSPIAVDAAPFDVLVAFGRIWVTAWEAGRVDVIDPRSLRVLERIDAGPRPTGLTAAAGAVWVGFGRDATAIARIDPASGAVERVPVGERAPSWFVAGTPDLWVQANDGDLVQVDPATRRVVRTLRIGRTLAQGALAADGSIWIPDKEQSVVYRVDPRNGRVLGSFAAGRGAYFALRAFGSMWVTSYAGSDVWRFAPS